MKIFIFAASLRKDSLNKKLSQQINTILQLNAGIEIDYADFRDFEMPVYDGDLETATGLPDGVKKLIQRIQSADALIISTPEYNGSIPGALKNAIDWVSRFKPNPFSGKHVLLTGASPGALGAVRGLWHTRVPLEALGAHVYPEMFGLSQAHEAFDESSQLKDPKKKDQVSKLINNFISFAK